jgi:hypothetical protein
MDGIIVPVTYKREWDDGFGARGWKLDISAHDPEIIASTAYPGENIPTSVLIHDILDHLVSGFGPSGHRNEAMALMQLHLRTGSSIHPDIQQMIEEDILQGCVIGETLESFLPHDLLVHLPGAGLSGKEKMTALVTRLGRERVLTGLLNLFHELGVRGIPLAETGWKGYGLDYSRRTATGLCLQSLLENADQHVSGLAADHACGDFIIGNTACALRLSTPHDFCMTQSMLVSVKSAPSG